MNNTQEKAEQIFHSLEAPFLKYGQGITVNLQEFPFNEMLLQLKKQKESVLQITADPRVVVQKLSLEDETVQKYLTVPYDKKMTALHYAGCAQVHVITIPANIILEKPIQISYNAREIAHAETIIIIVEPFSKVVIMEQISDKENVVYTSAIIQVHALEGADVTYCTVPKNSLHSSNIVIKQGSVQKNASLRWYDVVEGTFAQRTINSVLEHAEAETKSYLLFVGEKKALYDINVEVIHRAPATKSILKSRGVLHDAAKVTSRGLAKVEQAAVGAQAQHRADVLLLSETARCDAIPVLDVAQENVTCSHAVTMSQPDEEQLFYLLSRGLDEETARKMIIAGFLESMIQESPIAQWRDW